MLQLPTLQFDTPSTLRTVYIPYSLPGIMKYPRQGSSGFFVYPMLQLSYHNIRFRSSVYPRTEIKIKAQTSQIFSHLASRSDRAARPFGTSKNIVFVVVKQNHAFIHLLWDDFENRKRTLSCRKINHQYYGPEAGDFFGFFFSVIIFGTASNRKWGSIFDQHSRSKLASGFGFPHILGGTKRRDMPKTAVVPRPRQSAMQATGPVLLDVPRYPPRHASGITTSRWDVVVVIVSTTRAVAVLRNHNF